MSVCFVGHKIRQVLNQWLILIAAVVTPFAFISTERSFAESAAPNIVVILADDLGWNAVGYHNPEFKTPNIDRLAKEGIELDRFYVAPMCSPTRAGLMTGRYPIRFGMARAVIPPQRDFGLPNDETTIAEILKRAGYEHRGVFGKWHLGHRRAKWHPLNQGFTHFHGHYNGAIDYFELTREDQRDWHENFETSSEQGYATDLIADAASEWIIESAKSSAPYFCYVPFNAPHSPFQAPESAMNQFSDMSSGPAKAKGKKRSKKGGRNVRQTYAAMIWQMDQGIGKLIDAISKSGESDNTLVVFFSDNGGVGSIRENNAPLRGSKLTVYEGGIRVPACIRWPARLQPGQQSDLSLGYIDLLPTLAAAAGVNASQWVDKPLDGIDFLPALESGTDSAGRRPDLHRPWYSYHGQSGPDSEHLAVTLDGWKLKVNGPRLRELRQLTDGSNDVELFHLQDDLLEKTSLQSTEPNKLTELGALLIQHRNLQPNDSVPPYSVGKKGFVPPQKWKLDPSKPEQLVGK